MKLVSIFGVQNDAARRDPVPSDVHSFVHVACVLSPRRNAESVSLDSGREEEESDDALEADPDLVGLFGGGFFPASDRASMRTRPAPVGPSQLMRSSSPPQPSMSPPPPPRAPSGSTTALGGASDPVSTPPSMSDAPVAGPESMSDSDAPADDDLAPPPPPPPPPSSSSSSQ